jgi:hypothetical protein
LVLPVYCERPLPTRHPYHDVMHVREKRKRKDIQSGHVLSVGEAQAMVDQDHVKAEVREEMSRLKRKPKTCSKCGI